MGAASFPRWYHVLAICLFAWASYHQHICHKILARLRTSATTTKKGTTTTSEAYSRPNGDWFEIVSCPHFLAEVLIYVAMLLCCLVTKPYSCWWLVVVYVLASLGLSARQTHAWYRTKYEDYPKQRRAIIPWIW